MKDLIEGLQILEKYADPRRPIMLYGNYIYVDVQTSLWKGITCDEKEWLLELGFEKKDGLKAFCKAVV